MRKLQTVMQETVVEGLPVRIVRVSGNRFRMRIDTDGKVLVTAPAAASGNAVEAFIRQHRRWAQNALARRERSMDGRVITDFSNGRTVFLWGKPLTLRIALCGPAGQRRAGVYTDGSTAVMVPKAARGADAGMAKGAPSSVSAEEGRALLKEWYRAETKKALAARIPAMEARVGKHAETWHVKDTRSQWGSCTAPRGQNARISICLWLAAYPPEALEYVMVHELCHMYEMNHSPRFWAQVERVMPDWAARRRMLKR